MPDSSFLKREDLHVLLAALQTDGYECIGPTVKDDAIVYDTVKTVADLAQGVQDTQEPGSYRLQKTPYKRNFSWANGPQALKPITFKPREELWRSRRTDTGQINFQPADIESSPKAVIGVRACDLAALYIHDKHFTHATYSDPNYNEQRKKLFLVAVNCTHPSASCFCASTGDGPRATYGYDLVLSELDEGFIIEARSARGADMLQKLPVSVATDEQLRTADKDIDQAARNQLRRIPSRNLRDVLFERLEHPRWQDVGARCLSCGNCASVCPTCFCHSEHETPDLNGTESIHYREWDTCFTQGHSYIHGITIRAETPARYRQWLTHKFGSWHDQFGRSGCVGCGRCITWCPVGIDVVEEIFAICS